MRITILFFCSLILFTAPAATRSRPKFLCRFIQFHPLARVQPAFYYRHPSLEPVPWTTDMDPYLERFFSGNHPPKSNFLQRTQPWAMIAAGSAVAAYGISRRSVPGTLLAALGGYTVYRGIVSARGKLPARPVHVSTSFNIQRSPDELFQFWRNFENLPRFMRHLESVRTTGARQSHWVAHAPMGMTVSWDAEVTDERENDYIVWRSLPGALVPNRGSIQFRPDLSHGGTVVDVALDYAPPAGHFAIVFAKMFGREPQQQIRQDLRRFKALMEANEIPTTEGQPSGRRTPWVRMMQAATSENRATANRTA